MLARISVQANLLLCQARQVTVSDRCHDLQVLGQQGAYCFPGTYPRFMEHKGKMPRTHVDSLPWWNLQTVILKPL